MKHLLEISKKKERLVIGLMSGTSLDGVDAALVRIKGQGLKTKLSLEGYIECRYDEGLKDCILKNSQEQTASLLDITRLNFAIPFAYKRAVDRLLSKLNLKASDIDLIGSHGQTIQHLPQKIDYLGYTGGASLQIGDPSVLAKMTGILTVGNFRMGDIALGGEGAPLVPYFDYLIFHSKKKNRALLNIGGISNFTILPHDGLVEDTLAFDTGPGNMMIDLLAKKFFNEDFDPGGKHASSGSFNQDLFDALLMRDSFIEAKPPKSTGRELYGVEFLAPLLEEFSSLPGPCWMHTVTKFTAYAVYRNYDKFIKGNTKIDELIVSGGGARNCFLLDCLRGYFSSLVKVKVLEEEGMPSDAKEAICFAVLANETISGNASNIPATTGASRGTILGEICLP